MEPYDAIKFLSNSSRWLHPEQIIASAYLAGAECAIDIDTMNLLEIGCGVANNLVPLALQYPQARFVGIEPAELAYREALNFQEQTKCSNLLLHNSPLEESPGGNFDLILLHGLWSWVAPPTQQAVLRYVQENLREGGLLHCSHNIAPGWSIRQAVWQILQNIPDDHPKSRLLRARKLLEQLETEMAADRHFGSVILPELMRLKTVSDGYLFHELLNPHTSGSTLTELVNTFAPFDLHFFCDSRWSRNSWHPSPSELGSTRASQACWHDYKRGHAFRESIFLKGNSRKTELTSTQVGKSLECCNVSLAFSSQVQFTDTESVWTPSSQSSEKTAWRKNILKEKLSTHWPTFIPVRSLDLGTSDLSVLLELLHEDDLYIQHPTRQCLTHSAASENGTVGALQIFPWVAYQASRGELITNGHHETVAIGGFEQNLIKGIASGQDTTGKLVDYLHDQVPPEGDPELKDPRVLLEIVQQGVDTLKRALLVY